MRSSRQSLAEVLRKLDGRPYKLYRQIVGVPGSVGRVTVEVVKTQPDPYAPPSIVKAKVPLPRRVSRLVPKYRKPVEDLIHRRLYRALRRRSSKMGSGRSGYLGVPKPSPVMLSRSAVEIDGDYVTFRVWVGLPAQHRRIDSYAAEELLLKRLPEALTEALALSEPEVQSHIAAWEVQEHIRRQLDRLRIVAFVGNGSVLPRRCGRCDEPLPGAVPFESPPSLRVEIETPHGTFTGMGVPKGITLIVGPPYHGKTTLAEAIAHGVYNHVPGDGRELVVSDPSTVHVFAENGRYVSCVDISPFFVELPGNVNVRCFSTADASGATSVATYIQESLEVGAQLLVLDEDYVPTNILLYDEAVEKYVSKRTVVTISERARELAAAGVSLIIVSSGLRQLVDAADTIIAVEDYRVKAYRKARPEHPSNPYPLPKPRILRHARPPRTLAARLETIYSKDGGWRLELGGNIHIVEEGQVKTIARIVSESHKLVGNTMHALCKLVEEKLSQGFEAVAGPRVGPDLAEVRCFEIVYALNRLPFLKFGQQGS